MKPRMIVLAVSSFLAGFVACYWLVQLPESKPTPAGTGTAPLSAPVALLNLPIVATQTLQIDGGVWYQWPDGTMQRTAAPDERPGYYDLIETRVQPEVDFRSLK